MTEEEKAASVEAAQLDTELLIKVKRYKRLRYGDENLGFPREDFKPQCHDCDVSLGQIHHWHCDVEQCPKCGGNSLVVFVRPNISTVETENEKRRGGRKTTRLFPLWRVWSETRQHRRV
jgi:hypothetical protein